MYKLIIIAALVAYCFAAPADNNRDPIQYIARPGYRRPNVPALPTLPRVDFESEEWGVDKREAPETESVQDAAVTTTENPDLERIRAVNALVDINPPTTSYTEAVSPLF